MQIAEVMSEWSGKMEVISESKIELESWSSVNMGNTQQKYNLPLKTLQNQSQHSHRHVAYSSVASLVIDLVSASL